MCIITEMCVYSAMCTHNNQIKKEAANAAPIIHSVMKLNRTMRASKVKLNSIFCAALLLSRCGEPGITSSLESSNTKPLGTGETSASEREIREYIESTDERFDGYPCDSIIVIPNEDIDYTMRDIPIIVDPSTTPSVTDPGAEWCTSPALEEV